MSDINEVEILLAEDNYEDAEMTIRALKKVNLANRLVHVDDGEQALNFMFGRGEYAGRQGISKPRLILLDIKMPKVDGIEVLRQLKEHPVTKFIPVVMMTSSAEEKDLFESYNLGVNSYVVKPVDFTQFFNAVGDLGLYWLVVNRTLPQNQT